MKRASSIAFVMLCLLHDVSWASGSVRESLAKLPARKRIEVTLKGGDKLVGRLGAVEFDHFVLEPDRRAGAQRVLRFEEVRSVRTKMTTAQKWEIAGGVYAVLLVISLVLGK